MQCDKEKSNNNHNLTSAQCIGTANVAAGCKNARDSNGNQINPELRGFHNDHRAIVMMVAIKSGTTADCANFRPTQLESGRDGSVRKIGAFNPTGSPLNVVKLCRSGKGG
ncbi:MAG: hypothetical protein FWG39_02555, partial [Alphaproteobacteria bacterium]|nr:hypothetical protein [Alphaproteobacteria bacterium]